MWRYLQFRLGRTAALTYNEYIEVMHRHWIGPYAAARVRNANPQKRTIICNGNTTQILPNLYDALIRLRQSRGRGVYWFDALCINQLDMKERTAQVELSKQTLVFLSILSGMLLSCSAIRFRNYKI